MKSRVLTITALGLAAAVLAACETTPIITPRPLTPPPPPPPPPTPAEEFAWSTARGANTLIVEVAYHPNPNQQWSCSGFTEALMPETSYSRARMVTLYGSGERALQTTAEVRARSAANPGADYGQYVKTAACDGQNSFTVSNLPDGAYYVIAQVRQVKPANGAAPMVIMQRVELSGGRPLRITLPEGGPRAAAAAAPAPPRRRAPPQ